MPSLEYHYPDEATGTAVWQPTVCPVVLAPVEDDHGVITTALSDPLIVHQEQVGRLRRRWPWQWVMPAADRTSFRAFVADMLAAGGGSFEMIEPIDGEIVTVKFESFTWNWSYRNGLYRHDHTVIEVDPQGS